MKKEQREAEFGTERNRTWEGGEKAMGK